MKITNLDMDLFRSFSAIADTGSFTAAGKVVARSQSALSVHIKRLEHLVGCMVFERTSRYLALTPAGETLLGYARRILELNDESLRRMLEPTVTGEVRLGVTEYFLPGELAHILGRFAASYPDVHLEIRTGLSMDLRHELKEGELDVAIALAGPKDKIKPIWREPQQWVAREDFALKKEADVLPLVLLPQGCIFRGFAMQALKKARQPYRIAFTGSSMAGVQAAVMAGLGISIIPRSSVLSGMKVLNGGKIFPSPGLLAFAILPSRQAPPDIIAALENILVQTLRTYAAGRE